MIRKLIEFNKHKHTQKKKTKRNTVINEIVYEIKKNIEMIKKNRENKKKKTEYQRGILDPRENLDNLVWIK